MATEPLLSLRAVSFRPNGRTVLDAVGFEWNEEVRVCALIGPNGSGKSVLLRTAHGLLEPDEGEVRFEGRPPPATGSPSRGRRSSSSTRRSFAAPCSRTCCWCPIRRAAREASGASARSACSIAWGCARSPARPR